MHDIAKELFASLGRLLPLVAASDGGGAPLEIPAALALAARAVECRRGKGKLVFVGNGASAAISSHMSTDYWKNGGIRSMAFNDPSLLTCMVNDYGRPLMFAKPVEMFCDPQDMLVAISSSGQSENILNAAAAARSLGVTVMTLSGFQPDNPLRRLGDINFYVPCSSYGPVEVLHHAICHCILDTLLEHRRRGETCNG